MPGHKKRIRNWIIALVLLGLLVWGLYPSNKGPVDKGPHVTISPEALQSVPAGFIHWHPHLIIKVDGVEQSIPANIGINIGRVRDTDVGMEARMAPTHTHKADGIIHVENINARAKPETLTLGYFFYVWGKIFNSTCIFEYCNDKGTLTMTVNGNENQEFQNYLMHDKDEIMIEYTSKRGPS